MLERDWELLKILYKERNLTKASKKLYLSQPAVTRRLKMIEEEFNVKIVERNSRGVLFTEEGEYLVKYAEQMIENLNKIKKELDAMVGRIEGTIKIGSSNRFSLNTLPYILYEYKKIYPAVKFEVVTGSSNEMYKLLCDKKIDAAFIRGEYKWSQGKKKLFEALLCLINNEEFTKWKLPLMNRIDYSSDEKLLNQIEDWWQSNFSTSSQKGVTIDSIDSCIEMVRQGLGYAIVPSTTLKNTDKFFRMNLKDENGDLLKRNTRIFYHDDWKESKPGKAFLDFINTLEFNNK